MNYYLSHAGIKGMKWGYTKDPNYKPVGEPAKGENRNRPRGRQKNVTGTAKPVYRRESVSSYQRRNEGRRTNKSNNPQDYTIEEWTKKQEGYQNSWNKISSKPGVKPGIYDNVGGDPNETFYNKQMEWQKKYTDYYKRGPKGTLTGPTNKESSVADAKKLAQDVYKKYYGASNSKKASWIDKGKKWVKDLITKLFGGSGKITYESHFTTIGPTLFGEEYDANTGHQINKRR